MKKLLFFTFLLFFLGHIPLFSQNSFCGSHYSSYTTTETDCQDRFGNYYDAAYFESSGVLSETCEAGYFTLTYLDTGAGSFSLAERNTICAAFEYISDVISQGGDPTTAEQVQISVSIDPDLPSEVLAAASPLYFSQNCGTNGGSAWEKINFGSDFNSAPNNADGVLFFAPGVNWSFCIDPNTCADPDIEESDLYSVALHEATHILGFSSGMTATGDPQANGYSHWDRHLFTADGTQILNLGADTEACCQNYVLNNILQICPVIWCKISVRLKIYIQVVLMGSILLNLVTPIWHLLIR